MSRWVNDSMSNYGYLMDCFGEPKPKPERLYVEARFEQKNGDATDEIETWIPKDSNPEVGLFYMLDGVVGTDPWKLTWLGTHFREGSEIFGRRKWEPEMVFRARKK